jgi:acetoin utilization protein AcuB
MMTPSPFIVARYMTRDPKTIGPDASVDEALATMRGQRVRHLAVRSLGDIVGIVSERDLFAAREGGPSALVSDAMTPYPYVVAPEAPIAIVAKVMAEGKFGGALVMAKDRLIGIFTTTDALRALVDIAAEIREPARRAS